MILFSISNKKQILQR